MATLNMSAHIEIVEDVFSENSVFCLRATGTYSELTRIGCAAWTVSGESPRVAHRTTARDAVLAMRKRLDDHRLWLLACHRAAQSDSAVVHRRKLWASLRAAGLVVPHGRRTDEMLVTSQDGVRYFGALQLGLGGLDSVVALLEAESACHVVALRSSNEQVVLDLVRRGWTVPDFGPSLDVLFSVCAVDGILFWPLGAFDDAEAGFVALAPSALVHELVR